MVHNPGMFGLVQGATFKRCLSRMKDRQAAMRIHARKAAMRIHARMDRMACGNFGDAKSLRNGIFEMRMDHGPGSRVCFVRRGMTVIVLLAGGVKNTRDADILWAGAIKFFHCDTAEFFKTEEEMLCIRQNLNEK